jgi:hypothetical protein
MVSSTAASGRRDTTITNATAEAASSAHFISRVSPGPFSPSGRMNSEQSVGLMTRPTNSEELRVMIRVRGRYPMNSPTIPGQNISGVNAARVVAVAAMTGTATSPVASLAASFVSYPRSRKR